MNKKERQNLKDNAVLYIYTVFVSILVGIGWVYLYLDQHGLL